MEHALVTPDSTDFCLLTSQSTRSFYENSARVFVLVSLILVLPALSGLLNQTLNSLKSRDIFNLAFYISYIYHRAEYVVGK